jgi:hypothetical protein
MSSLEPFSELTQAPTLRVLVQMHDSEFEDAWIVRGRKR